jgi:antitoxin component of RelBE/YafQ-DinJ toxin-antitoxin module
MQTKLTLRLDDQLIHQAKLYAKTHGKSVSQVVADYFRMLNSQTIKESKLPPTTQLLKGLLANAEINEENYKKHLEKKYL